MFDSSVNIKGRVQRTFTVATGISSEQLTPGVYDVWADGDVYMKVDSDVAAAKPTSSTGYLLKSGNTVPFRVTDNAYLLAGGGTATNVYYHKVG